MIPLQEVEEKWTNIVKQEEKQHQKTVNYTLYIFIGCITERDEHRTLYNSHNGGKFNKFLLHMR